MHGQVFKQDTVEYKPFLVNITLNICDFLMKRVTNFYVTFAIKEVSKYLNVAFPKKCPVKPVSELLFMILNLLLKMSKLQLRVMISNYSVDASLIKSLPIPVGNYLIKVHGYIEDQGRMTEVGYLKLFLDIYESWQK